MRPLLIGLALLTGPGLIFAACSQDPISAATSTTGAGGGPDCMELSIGPSDDTKPCNVCLHHECCAQTSACLDTPGCVECLSFFKSECGPESRAVNDCLLKCYPSCSPNWPPTTTSSGSGGSGGNSGTTGSSASGG